MNQLTRLYKEYSCREYDQSGGGHWEGTLGEYGVGGVRKTSEMGGQMSGNTKKNVREAPLALGGLCKHNF